MMIVAQEQALLPLDQEVKDSYPAAMGEFFREWHTPYSIFSSSSHLRPLEPRVTWLENVKMHSTGQVKGKNQVKSSFTWLYLTKDWVKNALKIRVIGKALAWEDEGYR